MASRGHRIVAASLGEPAFLADHRVKYAYVAGSMVRGIASEALVARMARAGLLAFFGTGGCALDRIESAITSIRSEVGSGPSFGMNLLHNLVNPDLEDQQVELFLKHGVPRVEASAFMQAAPSIVRYRLTGAHVLPDGTLLVPNHVFAKVSRPEVATQFMSPPPERIVRALVEQGRITEQEARLSQLIPLAQDICVEADSGGHTDKGVAYAQFPAMLRLRDAALEKHRFSQRIRIGAAGGLGTPQAIAAAFVMGADFVLTGSINQCTVEAGTSDLAKDLLQAANVQDMEMAPAGDMFEIGAKVQVLKKGLFFAARANKLYDLYSHHDSLDDIDSDTRRQLETKYFKKSFDEVYEETKRYFREIAPDENYKAEQSPKHKMALVFRWYFGFSNHWALEGVESEKVNFQIHCGPALGSFNQWVKGSALESWRNRHVDEIAELMMTEAAALLDARLSSFESRSARAAETALLDANLARDGRRGTLINTRERM